MFKVKMFQILFLHSLLGCILTDHETPYSLKMRLKEIEDRKVKLKIGALMPKGSNEEEFIYQRFVQQGSVLFSNAQNYSVELIQRKTTCRETELSEETSRMIYVDEVDMIFGPHCSSDPCRRVMEAADYHGRATITYHCDDASFLGIEHYLSVFPETKKHPQDVVKVFKAIMDVYTWKYLGILYSRENRVAHNTTATGLTQSGISVSSFSIETYGINYASLFDDVKENARVLLFLCSSRELIRILDYFQKQITHSSDKGSSEMDEAQWAIFTLDYHLEEISQPPPLIVDVKRAMDGVLNIRAKESKDYKNRQKYHDINQRAKDSYGTKKSSKWDDYFSDASYMYDSFWIYKNALDSLIEQKKEIAIQHYLRENKFEEFFDLNNITLEEYQEFIEWNVSRFDEEESVHLHETESPGTTSTTPLPSNGNSSLLNITTNGNLTAPLNNTTTSNITTGRTSPTAVTNSTLPTNSTPTTTTQTTTPKYMRWLQHQWRFNETWTPFINETETPDTPEWYLNNNTLPDIDIIGVLSNISYEELLKNTSQIIKEMKISNFTGLSGKIDFDTWGFRTSEFIMENIVGNVTTTSIEFNEESTTAVGMIWYGGYLKEPKDIPKCGFTEICEGSDWTLTIIMGCIVGVLFVCFMAYRAYKMQKYENDIHSKDSIVRFKDLTTNIVLPHATLVDIIEKKGEMNPITNVYRLDVFYNGNRLMLKKLPKTGLFMDRNILMELKHLRDLNAPNINKFRGVTNMQPNICFLHDFCAKGSLYDILSKEDVQLDWDFKHTFINDIATGMLAIHDSPIKSHGHLTSKNCLVNHRWVIEIGDFGLTNFRKPDDFERKTETDSEYEHKRCVDLLWTAPENLTLPEKMSRAGDVFSFGIIVSEIINQQPPYTEREEMQPHEIIHYIRKRCIPPFRPHVTLKIGLNEKLVELMKSCWSENPDLRPTFRQVRPITKQIRGNKVEIIDNMISMMEKYTRGLEKSVKEGTDVLHKERNKNNEFLYKTLPKPIGDAILKEGGQAVEHYDIPDQGLLMVTVHEFTRLGYPAAQCIDILNDFHKLVEKVLVNFRNVYRLYTFREEIMFCSGVQGFTTESTSQDLLSVAIKIANARDLFPWRHIRNRKLHLRITLHGGPGVGIVIGNKVPTFCSLGNHYEVIKVLNLNSPEEKIIMTEEFRKQVKLIPDQVMKSSVEILVSTYIGKVKPEVIYRAANARNYDKDQENRDLAKLSKKLPYEIPAPRLTSSEENEDEVVKHMDVASNIETMFEKWHRLEKEKKEKERARGRIILSPLPDKESTS
eukprot:TCONS_00023167-protein